MATVTINNSPVHSEAIITYPYGVADSSYSCGWHTGLDFAPYGVTEANPWLYSVVSGEVVYIETDQNNALGIYVLILANDNTYWRYCHMVEGSLQVQVGDLVTTASPVGRMGDTGNVTGVHLHLEHATSYSWTCNTFLNPADYLQIPNEDDTIVLYSGSPVPPIPTEIKKTHFPWVLYTRKLREKRSI